MRAPLTVGAFVGALALAFGLTYAVGAALDPVSGTGHAASVAAPSAALPGLAVTDAGYTLSPAGTALPAGDRVPFAFTIDGPDREPVTRYLRDHEKELHLIVVRRDLAGFQHVHPVRTPDGTWSTVLDLPAGGTYRVFADFEPDGLGRGLTLGTDVHVTGPFASVPLPPAAEAGAAGPYRVTSDGIPVAGKETELKFTVTDDGRGVTELEPYLGAFGHLVSLRDGDLAYLHTHPVDDADGQQRGGPDVRFATTFPTPGGYRLFLDVQVDGAVHTAEFTVEVP